MTAAPKPNWGRSWPLNLLQSGSQELIRLQFAESDDITLCIGDTGTQFAAGVNALLDVSITHGNGGVVANETLRGIPANGLVRHVVASYVQVTARYTGVVPILPSDTRRASAHAGRGTPRTHKERQLLTFSGPTLVQTVRLLPWTRAIRLYPFNGSALASFSVLEATAIDGAGNTTIGTQAGTAYAQETAIAGACNAITMNSGGVPMLLIFEQIFDL